MYDRKVCAIALSRVFACRCSDGRKLIEKFGSPENVFEVSEAELRSVMTWGEPYIKKLLEKTLIDWAHNENEWCKSNNVTPMYVEESGYPSRLAECCDAPIILYVKGNISLNPKHALAVVGTRRCTPYGKNTCRRAVSSLALIDEPPVIISGLAYGIDGTAHCAALEQGLPTVAVLPTGLDTIYPPQHRELACSISRHGALVSDFARGTKPMPFTFVRRNRIIAGMADATFVVESFAKGGSLITAAHANSYDREVLALPGRVDDPASEGCNKLIERNIAHIVTGAESICNTMGWTNPEPAGKVQRSSSCGDDIQLSRTAKSIIEVLGKESHADTERLCELISVSVSDIGTALVELELSGRIICDKGHRYSLR